MALFTVNPCGAIEYAVPQAVIDAAPIGAVYRHFAWFHHPTGVWIGEWAGYVPRPDLPARFSRPRRTHWIEAWQQDLARWIGPDGAAFPTVDAEWDRDAWDACPSHGAVSLDVTRFRWPVGDHVWHRWDAIDRELYWPESSGHKFIELTLDTGLVVANTHSHRPIRDAVPGQAVFDITGTALEPFWGSIWGRFARHGDRHRLEPSSDHDWLITAKTRRALMEAPIVLDLAHDDVRRVLA